ncbi:MAG: YdjY domain-containing protein [Verrucomicrobiota bacterium]
MARFLSLLLPSFLLGDLAVADAMSLPAVEAQEDGTFLLGEIHFDPGTREIRLPARTGESDAPLEYALVSVRGKVHETLLVTAVPPSHLQTALLLCHYQPSTVILERPRLDNRGNPVRPLEEDERQGPRAAPPFESQMKIRLEWSDESGQLQSYPLSELIQNQLTEAVIPDSPWIFTGSRFFEGGYMADITGSIMATYLDADALLNLSWGGNQDDENWFPRRDLLPPLTVKATLVLTPLALPEES